MLPRGAQVFDAITKELQRHEKALEVDQTIKRIDIRIFIGERSGDPVKITYGTFSETDLTKK